MNTRAAIEELLRAGYSDKAIARQLHVHRNRVRDLRDELDIPQHKPGPSASGSPEDLFWRRAQPTDDGHLLWPWASTCVRIGHDGPRITAARLAFRIRHGRDPEGKVTNTCARIGCIHPDHVADQPMRAQARQERLTQIPRRPAGRQALTPAQAFDAHTTATADGHLDWTGTRLATTPSVYVNGRQTTARRLAFQLRYGRDPIGRALPGCGYDQCVHPDHIEDQPMRQQYAAIFGEVAA